MTIIQRVLFFIGLILFGVNIAGFFIPLRNPEIYQQETGFHEDITLTEDELYEVIDQKGETSAEYVTRLNQALNKGISHFWLDEGIDKYNLRIPIHENWWLFFASFINPEKYEKWEYINYKKAIERGVGLCSQHAIIMAQILQENGLNSNIVELTGHAVVRVQIDQENDTWWIADPDYGVLIEYDLGEVEKDPEIIKTDYLEKGYAPVVVDNLAKIYGKEGNFILPSDVREVYLDRYRTESRAYIFIWVIPAILILPYSLSYLHKKKDNKSVRYLWTMEL